VFLAHLLILARFLRFLTALLHFVTIPYLAVKILSRFDEILRTTKQEEIMKLKRLSILLLSIVTLGFIVGCSKTPEGIADKIVSKLERKLDLNSEQLAKLEKLKVAALNTYKRKKETKNKKIETVLDFIKADSLDQVEVKKLMTEKHETKMQELDKLFPLINDFHSSLSSEQKEKAAELIQWKIEKFKKWK
jgi:hypothetical protein